MERELVSARVHSAWGLFRARKRAHLHFLRPVKLPIKSLANREHQFAEDGPGDV